MVSRSKPILPSIHTHPAGGPQQWCNCHPRKGRILLVEGHLVVELTLKDNKCIPVQNHLSKDNVLTRKQIDLCTWRCITTQALTQNTALRSLTKGGNYLKNKKKKICLFPQAQVLCHSTSYLRNFISKMYIHLLTSSVCKNSLYGNPNPVEIRTKLQTLLEVSHWMR